MPRPRSKAWQARLKLALARDWYTRMYAPPGREPKAVAPAEWTAILRMQETLRREGCLTPAECRDYVERWEHFVRAVSGADRWPERVLPALRRHALDSGAELLFVGFVRAGANPDRMADILGELVGGQRSRRSEDRRKCNVELARAKRLAREFANLATSYETFRRQVRRLPVVPLLEAAAISELRKHADTLRIVARALDWRRRRSTADQAVIDFQNHLRLTTGTYHDSRVADLFDALHEGQSGWEDLSAEALERRRARARSKPLDDSLEGMVETLVLEEFKEVRIRGVSLRPRDFKDD